MNETALPSHPISHNTTDAKIRELFNQNVIPSYGRLDLTLSHGSGSHVYDVNGRRYLDLGGGIAVCSLGHAHPAMVEALTEQARRLIHVSNLYYTEPQGRLAQALVRLIGPGKCFFANSGGEANEGLFKLARKFGHDEGRFEILTTVNSFHGRTLAGIAATGQDKVKKGFEPMVAGFRQVPYNDLAAMRAALSPATAAILVEDVQGEGGVTPATAEYLLGLRALCDEKKLLLLLDCVQSGHFRSGRFQSFQRILENTPGGEKFLPDGVSMAKSLGGGFPIGAFWARAPYADLLSPGTHATTYGGSPLACAVALKVLSVIENEKLADNARHMGEFLAAGLQKIIQQHPRLFRGVRGFGLILGLELAADIPLLNVAGKTPAAVMTAKMQEAGLLLIPAGTRVLRILPALNLSKADAEEGLAIIAKVAAALDA